LTLQETAVQYLQKPKIVGQSLKRREDPRLIQGKGIYSDDVKLPGLLHVAFYRSPYAHARIKKVDTSKARILPGVEYVLTAQEDSRQLHSWMDMKGLRIPERPSLALEKVRFVGEPIVAIAAETKYIAEDAKELVEVEFEPLPAVVNAEQAMTQGAPVLYEKWGGNLMFEQHFKGGDVEGAFRRADYVFSETLKSHRYSLTPIENRVVVADYDKANDQLTVYTSTQFPHVYRTFLAEILNLQENRIRVTAPNVGGGFGIKSAIFQDEIATCVLSLKLGRPVKFVEDRKEHLLIAGHAREQTHHIQVAAKKDGRILGIKNKIIADFGSGGVFWTEVQPAMLASVSLPGPYDIKSYNYDLYCVVTNKGPYGPHRGFGRPVGAYVIERMVDIIARKIHLDPAEVRLRNMIEKDEMPYTTVIGVLYDSGNYKELLHRALKFSNYYELRKMQEDYRRLGRYIGIGLGTYVEYTAPGSSRLQGPLGWKVGGYETASLSIDPSGKITARLGVASQGQSHETVFAQVIADELGAKYEDIVIQEGDTSTTPYGFGAWASRSTVAAGGACVMASRRMKEKLLRVAEFVLGIPSSELTIEDGVIFSRASDNSSRNSITIREAADLAIRMPSKLPPGMEPGLDVVAHYEPEVPTTCSTAVHICVVEVDIETGLFKILKYYVVDDSGVLINPQTAHGQVHGAVAHGIGGTIYEQLLYNDDGQLLSSTFVDYLVPTSMEVPDIQVDSMETPSLTLGGFKGMGEGGAIASPATIANGVEDALSQFGIKIRETPLSPEKVYYLIKQAERK
jgi:carbon-monoxide dehydrogenase large subunit